MQNLRCAMVNQIDSDSRINLWIAADAYIKMIYASRHADLPYARQRIKRYIIAIRQLRKIIPIIYDEFLTNTKLENPSHVPIDVKYESVLFPKSTGHTAGCDAVENASAA